MNGSGAVLVTGAGGYLGGHVVRALRERGRTVVALGRAAGPGVDAVADMTAPDAVRDAVERASPRWVVHAAARVPRTLDAYGDQAAAAESAGMVRHLCGALAAAAPTAGLILVSSMTVYGPRAPVPVGEDAATEPGTAYARGKLEAERIATASGVRGFAVRVPGLYGAPREGGLVANLAAAMRAGAPPRLPDAPLQWAAMDVADAADAIAGLADAGPTGFVPVNVGYAGPASIDRMVRLMADAAGRVTTYAVRHPTFEYDLARWHALTGTQPKPFARAMAELVA